MWCSQFSPESSGKKYNLLLSGLVKSLPGRAPQHLASFKNHYASCCSLSREVGAYITPQSKKIDHKSNNREQFYLQLLKRKG